MSSAESMRRHRANPENRQRGQLIVNARSAALAELADMFPAEYEDLCNKHRQRLGLPPLRTAFGRRPTQATLDRLPLREVG